MASSNSTVVAYMCAAVGIVTMIVHVLHHYTHNVLLTIVLLIVALLATFYSLIKNSQYLTNQLLIVILIIGVAITAGY